MELFLLCGLAFLAGLVDSIVGGGGLIQIPALFLFLPAHLQSAAAVLGTNKLVSMCGTGMALFQYSRRIRIHWNAILPSLIPAFVFSFLGARAVSAFPTDLLKPVILFLLVAVFGYTLWRKDFGSLHAPNLTTRQERLAGVAVGVVIGFYDGFFGPGTGSFLIFVFIGIFGFDFLTSTAGAKAINFATNVSATGYFAWTGNILYEYAVPMGVCNLMGGMIGARLAILQGNRFVRLFFLAIMFVLIVRLAWTSF